MRQPHLLSATHKMTRPNRIIFVDTETKERRISDKEGLLTLKMGVAQLYAYSTDEGMIFREEHLISTAEDFWSWLDDNCWSSKTTHLVAHNIYFDLQILGAFERLADLGWKLESFYSKGMVSIYRWSKDRCRLTGLDNANFFRGKLEKWGEILGYPKLEVDFDTVTDKDLLTYCRRDVKIMVKSWETWMDFIDDNDCGNFNPTIASTAFGCWRHRFMPDTVYIHSDEAIIDLEREAFKGARTECLWVGTSHDGPFYYLDVNNMYGYIMQAHTYPNYMIGTSDDNDIYSLAYKLERYDVIAQVTIEVDEPWFPQVHSGFTCYPIGEIDTVLTTPELKLCMDKDWIRSVGKTVSYRSSDLFHDFVHEFRRIRQDYEDQGLDGYAKICKLFVNAVYGKFGQRGFKQELVGECPTYMIKREEIYDTEQDKHYDYIYLAGGIYREWREGESYNSFPAICAHVTAYARTHLYSLIRVVPQGHAYYMDTDSLIVDQIGYDALKPYIQPHTLGMLKVEVQSPWLTIYAPKDYKMEGRHKTKGVKDNAEEIEPGVFIQTQFMRLQGMIRDGMTEGLKIKEITKTQVREIHSGQVLPSGWVLPFRFAPSQTEFHPQSHLEP